MNCACCGQAIPDPPSAVHVVAAEYPGAPIAEMLTRGWLGDQERIRDAAELRDRLLRFFDVESEAELRRVLRIPRAALRAPTEAPTKTG